MRRINHILLLVLLLFSCSITFAQTDTPLNNFNISGTMGMSYEHYGLSRNPSGWMGFMPRRPWNQVRFNFAPDMKFGKNFSLPFNFNFSTNPTNYAGPYAGIGKQSFSQFITNPMNNFGLNPKLFIGLVMNWLKLCFPIPA